MKERVKRQRERDQAMDQELYNDFYDPDKRKKRKKNVRIGFCICLAIMLVASLINWGIITNWGQVQIDRISVKGDDGGTYSALVYTPSNATDENPAPLLICYHGNSGSGRNHESWAMEFARRGFVVISPDLMGAGDSQSTWDDYGMNGKPGKIDTPEQFYLYAQSMPNVDKDNIIVSGHSMGAEPAQYIGGKYQTKAVINASGMPWGIFNDDFQSTWDASWKSFHGDYLYVVGEVETPAGGGYRDPQEIGMEVLSHYPEFSDVTEFEPGKLYGSFEDGDAVMLQVEQRVHEAAFVSTETIGHILDFGQQCVDEVPNYIDGNDQVWVYKDFTGLFGMFSFVAFLCSLALLLIEEVPAFEYVRRPLARNVGFRGAGLIIACVIGLIVPWISLKTDAFGIIGGAEYANLEGAGFMMGYANMGFGIVVSLSIVAALGAVVYILTERKKKGLTLPDFGVTPYDYDKKQTKGEKVRAVLSMAIRTLALSLIVVAVGWVYIQLQLMVLGTDFYSFFFGVKDIPIDKVQYYWNYLAVFMLCFLILGIDMNVVRRLPSTGKENLDLILGMLVNFVVGCTVIIAMISLKWFFGTNVMTGIDSSWLFQIPIGFTRILGLPVGMTIGTTAATFIYKKTGNLWLCAFLVGTLACLLGVLYGQTRFHF